MINPLDRNFFKFFFGFLIILIISFGFLYIIAGNYAGSDEKKATVLPK